MSHVHDLVGVGIGPFNLSLAALAEPVDDLSVAFLESKPEFSWHHGLLIEGTTLQVPFLADLVTLIDPTSRWSFLSYLAAQERLFPFYFAENFHISRREYDHYCRWVADSLPSCRFGRRVTAVRWDAGDELFHVESEDVRTAERETLIARNVVLGVGTEPTVPEPMRGLLGEDVFHASEYLDRQESLRGAEDVTVIGSGQSGAEVALDLMRAQESAGWRVRWLTRSQAFAPMEYSKLGLEHFTPDYTRYFRSLPQETRDRVVPAQWQLYKASSAATLAAIHEVLYERSVGQQEVAVDLMPNVAVTGAQRAGDGVELACRHTEQERDFTVRTDRVVLATGYSANQPPCLEPLSDVVDWDARGRYQVGDDYGVALDPSVTGGLYVQNAEMHSHGVGAPDLGLGAHRAAVIVNAVSGRDQYSLPKRSAFTTFGVA
ncbi:lysine N(6)-hydroxylase/L-ornithine N(5)-oxygenase family protein [Saccharopolyspora dendranthemae]|uniref:L-lysine N6-monooxygenase MbtG n=1 Tax=Saccharopolyspora dendranthemae TaxID=1181886 RepID=A0A561U876_9PSEU|nr:lysine N(6)-hydroxylase/L-ornithine N(5)-oxygenase family protein [Saccharopolyspora dendranthemae]TWF95537.1 lysine N6-hydroxylase [Saccharopolyspora dendranthemae]